MGTQEYECPACGGVMEFNAASQKLKCIFCDTEMSVEEYKDMVAKSKAESAANSGKAGGTSTEETESVNPHKLSQEQVENAGFGKDKAVYICQSCGGEIIADQNQGAATCPFCGNNVTFKEVFHKGRRPDYIIPFKISKKEAKEKYKGFTKGKYLLPNSFTEENHIDEIKGVYIPYWLYAGKSHVSMDCVGTKVRTWSDSDYQYMETSYYNIARDGESSFEAVPVDGSSKMPNDLTESIEPYNIKEKVQFDDAYLAGFIANQYDEDENVNIERAKKRMTNTVVNEIKNTISGYSSINTLSQNANSTITNIDYALYPVWLLSTTWNNQHFLFAINGQTGKMVGNLPVDKKKAVTYFGISSVLFSILFIILELILKL
ncbi:hypothetical protein [Butyrivibrio sp. NC3005]|uniref:hypothetical protein n=1 Tax=Butyrivibrio sp. NC3005 TaxID=1280685 RepID=UPI00040591FB|nr:hypothetical protein [Butyrivibrio sp. NC3005]